MLAAVKEKKVTDQANSNLRSCEGTRLKVDMWWKWCLSFLMSHCLFLVTDSVCWIEQHLCSICGSVLVG